MHATHARWTAFSVTLSRLPLDAWKPSAAAFRSMSSMPARSLTTPRVISKRLLAREVTVDFEKWLSPE